MVIVVLADADIIAAYKQIYDWLGPKIGGQLALF